MFVEDIDDVVTTSKLMQLILMNEFNDCGQIDRQYMDQMIIASQDRGLEIETFNQHQLRVTLNKKTKASLTFMSNLLYGVIDSYMISLISIIHLTKNKNVVDKTKLISSLSDKIKVLQKMNILKHVN